MNKQLLFTQTYSEETPQWHDSLWFRARPNRTMRLRGIHPLEFQNVGYGHTHIIVQKKANGDRLRRGITLLAVSHELMKRLESESPNASDVDYVLSEVLRALLSGRTIPLQSLIDIGLAKYELSKSFRENRKKRTNGRRK